MGLGCVPGSGTSTTLTVVVVVEVPVGQLAGTTGVTLLQLLPSYRYCYYQACRVRGTDVTFTALVVTMGGLL